MKDLLKWLVCIIHRRHTPEYFEKRKTAFHQFYGRQGGRVATCNTAKELCFIK